MDKLKRDKLKQQQEERDWQLKCTGVKQRLGHLLSSGEHSDCAFLVGAEAQQICIEGHKLILATASPVFEAMFYGGIAEKNNPISILDVEPDAFKALMQYIYTDNIKLRSFDEACGLCYVAKKYMLPHLMKKCIKYLSYHLNAKNACRTYEIAKLFEELELMDQCMQVISRKTKEVLAANSFREAQPDTVIAVFSLDCLSIDSELDLFRAALRYANGCTPPEPNQPSTSKMAEKKRIDKRHKNVKKRSCSSCSSGSSSSSRRYRRKLKKVDSCVISVVAQQKVCELAKESKTSYGSHDPRTMPTKGKEDDEKVRSIRSAIQQIRFLTLTPKQFAEGPATSSLLSESEKFALIMNISSRHTDVALPIGFTDSRTFRDYLSDDSSDSSSEESSDSCQFVGLRNSGHTK